MSAEKYVVVVLPPGWAKQVTRDLTAIRRALGRITTMEEEIMTDQEHEEQDVAAIGTALDQIVDEIAALKAQPGAGALDFTSIDALVQRVQGVAADNAPTADAPAPTGDGGGETAPVG